MKPDSMQYMESGFFIPNCAIEGGGSLYAGYPFKTFLRRVNPPNTCPLLLIVLMVCLVSVHKNRQLENGPFPVKRLRRYVAQSECHAYSPICASGVILKKIYRLFAGASPVLGA